jgi:hypothetical protein
VIVVLLLKQEIVAMLQDNGDVVPHSKPRRSSLLKSATSRPRCVATRLHDAWMV